MRKKSDISFWLFWPLLWACVSWCSIETRASPSSDGEILSKLKIELFQRNLFIEKNELSKSLLFFNRRPFDNLQAIHFFQFEKQLKSQYKRKSLSPWGVFCLGVLQEIHSNKGRNPYFDSFLQTWESDWPKCWIAARILLSLENKRYTTLFLVKVHKELLSEGHTHIPELSTPLLMSAASDIRHHKLDFVEEKLKYAEIFDPGAPAMSFLRFQLFLLEAPLKSKNWVLMVEEILNILKRFNESRMVLQLWTHILQLIFKWLAIFCVSLVICLFIRKIPLALHIPSEWIAKGRVRWFHYTSWCLLLISFYLLGLGWVLFCLILLVLSWRFLTDSEKWIPKMFLIALAISPLWLMLESECIRNLKPGSAINFYTRAVERGMESELLKEGINLEVHNNLESSIKQSALSLLYRKASMMKQSQFHAKRAVELAPRNPIALGAMGAWHYHHGDLAESAKLYKRILSLSSKQPELYFNLSQIALNTGKNVAHQEFLNQSLEIDDIRVPCFVETNNFLFPTNNNQNSWPLARQIMDLPLSYGFLFQKLGSSFFNLSSDSLLWHVGYIDLPVLLWPLAWLFFLFLLLLAYHPQYGLLSGYRIYQCRLCEKAMCEHCKGDSYCSNCTQMISSVPDGDLKFTIVNDIRLNVHFKAKFLRKFGNAVFPGAGFFFAGQKNKALTLALLTSFLWALIILVPKMTALYPLSIFESWLRTLHWVMGFYYLPFWVSLGGFFIQSISNKQDK